jgi:hypothetical protein
MSALSLTAAMNSMLGFGKRLSTPASSASPLPRCSSDTSAASSMKSRISCGGADAVTART